MVEMGENRAMKETPPVVDALRDPFEALVRLADTLDEGSSNSLKP